jgi:hypothetical protein
MFSVVLAEELSDGNEVTLAESLRDCRRRAPSSSNLALALQATSVRVAQYTNGRVYLPATPAASDAVRQPTSPRWATAAAKLTN